MTEGKQSFLQCWLNLIAVSSEKLTRNVQVMTECSESTVYMWFQQVHCNQFAFTNQNSQLMHASCKIIRLIFSLVLFKLYKKCIKSKLTTTVVTFKACLLRNTKKCCVVFMITCYCFKLGFSSKLCPRLKITHLFRKYL